MREQNKDFYTVAEIITGLRSDYAILRAGLLELQKLLVVESDKKVSANLYFNSMLDCQNQDLQGVFVKIQEADKFYEVWQKYLSRRFYYNLSKAASLYHLKEINGRLIFVDETEAFVKHGYVKKIGFNDEDKAIQAYDKFKMTPFFAIPSVNVILNVYQSLLIDGDFIYFHNEDSRNATIDIIYDALSDEIRVNSSTKCSLYFLESLLETEVYKGRIPEKIRTLINNNNQSQRKISINDNVKYRKESFAFNYDYQKKLVLEKKTTKRRGEV